MKIEQLEESLALSTGQLDDAKAQFVADVIASESRIEQTEIALENTDAAQRSCELAVIFLEVHSGAIAFFSGKLFNDLVVTFVILLALSG